LCVKRKGNFEAAWAGSKKGEGKVKITSLNSHFPSRGVSTRCGKQKSAGKDSAFSQFKARYCSWISREEVWIKVCNVNSAKKTNEAIVY